ncbi:sigma 54-interacting transcriptional regulator [Haliangium ochraceum]|uniref:sigma 54-interacting transcriptional regulator n=1 Tax=Haliangium ochraceum TaxID=80816 RepID=UPI000BB4816D|nr:sigma 54-interacting transcriptional regulator [Haliangium ochraceum]
MEPAVRAPRFYLRGVIQGQEQTIELELGDHIVGSSRSADIVLPITGVSRRHARLAVTLDSLLVEDLGSTNGTQVDGDPVNEPADVSAGAELRFGPARLSVEAIIPDQDELALVFDSSSPCAQSPISRSAFDGDKSTHHVGYAPPGHAARWLSCIESFAAALANERPAPLAHALTELGDALGLLGACVVRWTGQPAEETIATWGALHSVPSLDEAERLVRRSEDGTCVAAFLNDESASSVAAIMPRSGYLLMLVLWGDFNGRLTAGGLLRTLMRLIEPLCRSQTSGGTTLELPRKPAQPPLRFPAMYQPGRGQKMRELYERMRRLTRSNISVLIRGETGVGKELIARILHDSSPRRDKPFIAVNCCAIPVELIEAEMFGVKRGVATGVEARPGHFQLAEGGTIFLDEVAEMVPALQTKLLRVLQEREIQPLGGSPQPIDVRVVAATNVDLPSCLADGRLRPDLYFRLAGCVLEVPPLRERREEIPELVEHFIRRNAAEAGVRVRGLTVAALRALTKYDWPGNIRELEHEMRRLVYISADSDIIGAERVALRVQPTPPEELIAHLVESLESLELRPITEALERHLILHALKESDGVKLTAARRLNLSRKGLDNKIERFRINAAPGDQEIDSRD